MKSLPTFRVCWKRSHQMGVVIVA